MENGENPEATIARESLSKFKIRLALESLWVFSIFHLASI
jgi:hypothetical protein